MHGGDKGIEKLGETRYEFWGIYIYIYMYVCMYVCMYPI